MEILIGIGVFVFMILLLQETYLIVKAVWRPEVRMARKRFRTISSALHGREEVDILKKKSLSQVPLLNRLLLRMPGLDRVEAFLEKANTPYPLGFFVLVSLLLVFSSYFLLSVFLKNVIPPPVSVAAGLLPFIYLVNRKRRRMRKMQNELPDALDLIARSLRAGHALTGGLKMVADEFDDPLGTEFAKTVDEINFGLGVPEALKNLSERVDCGDVRFFVLSIIIQRETGGNLAEILENLAYLIRERFKLFGKIRVLSAEGRVSAVVLVAIPFFVVAALSLFSPDYLKVLVTDPIGKSMIALSLLLMAFGIFVIKKMIRIRV